MTSIQSRGRPRRKRTFKSPLGSLASPEYNHDETLANFPALEPLVTKYIEEDLQKIF